MDLYHHHRLTRTAIQVLTSLLLLMPLLSATAAAREVRIGVYENPPKIFTEQGEPRGIFPQLLGMIAEQEGWQIHYVRCEWEDCLDLLRQGQIDLLPDVAYNQNRERSLDFHSTPVLYSWSQIYRRRDVNIESIPELDNKRVALLRGSVQQARFANMVQSFGLDVTIMPADTYEAAFQLTQSGQADAVIANHLFGGYKAPAFDLAETPIIFQPTRLYFAADQGANADLLGAIEQTLSSWKEDPASLYYAVLREWDQRVPASLVPQSIRLALPFILALLLITGIVALLLNQRLKTKTGHLLNAKNQLQATLDAMPDLLFELDAEGRYHDYHSPRTDLLAVPAEKLIGRSVHEVLPQEAAETTLAALREAEQQGSSLGRELELELADGRHWFELSVSCIGDTRQRSRRFIVLSRDITSRKQDALKIERLTRFYAALSQCNDAILHSTTVDELLPVICRNAVDYGGLKMAWIGMLDREGNICPVASQGVGKEYLEQIRITVNADDPSGQGPTSIAIREGHPIWSQDFAHDPTTQRWRDPSRRYHWASSASIPLRRGSEIVGAFVLYSDEINGFDQEVQNLLLEMSLDIGFALDQFALKAAHDQALLELRESEERYRLAFKTSPDAVNINRLSDGTYLDINVGFETMTGWKSEEIIGKSSAEMTIWRHPADSRKLLKMLLRDGICENFEAEFVMKNGDLRVGIMSAKEINLQGERCVLSITRDITELRRATDELRKLSLAVEQSPASIMITDRRPRIEYVNDTFVRTSGYSRQEAIGKNPSFQRSGKTPDKTYQEMWTALNQGQVWRGELFNRRKDGTEVIESTLIYPVRQANGEITHYLSFKEDISEKIEAQNRIHELAYFDQLTGLPNRSLLKEHFQYALNLAHRNKKSLALMYLDLDDFKSINDTLGHSVGDKLLVEVGNRMRGSLREEDSVSRMGGDEFIVLLPETDEHGAALVAEKLMATIAAPCRIDPHELLITSSIGIAIYPHDGQDMEILLQNADAAMHRVKQEMHNDYRFFTQEMKSHTIRQHYLANALRHAMERDQLRLHYQPQISIDDGRIVGAEALLRWQHPEYGMVSPAEFIPIAEQSGQIIRIGEWVVRTATRQLQRWLDEGLPDMVMAVNVSAAQFRHTGLQEMVVFALNEAGLPHANLELELTEAVAMKNPQEVVSIMDNLHAQGIRMSIDDFGTGYSSLSYLKRFNIHKLKIDQSFVRDILNNNEDKAIVIAIINLADSLGIRTIAEGVESAEQLAFLQRQGCNDAQGYYFSRPLPADEFEAFVRNRWANDRQAR